MSLVIVFKSVDFPAPGSCVEMVGVFEHTEFSPNCKEKCITQYLFNDKQVQPLLHCDTIQLNVRYIQFKPIPENKYST